MKNPCMTCVNGSWQVTCILASLRLAGAGDPPPNTRASPSISFFKWNTHECGSNSPVSWLVASSNMTWGVRRSTLQVKSTRAELTALLVSFIWVYNTNLWSMYMYEISVDTWGDTYNLHTHLSCRTRSPDLPSTSSTRCPWTPSQSWSPRTPWNN